ncbi:MAG TPA: DUF308 domain-containing protein [Gemmatimonadaceae bacterium]|nr:DUF308 domain-containing protein [Gemmatimonadaceae bacterium]
MTSNPIQSGYRRIWWGLVVRGALGVVLGVFIIWRPLDSVAAFALVIALWALLSGIAEIVHSFDLRPVLEHWWLMLLSGVISMGFGIAALYYYPGLSLTFAIVWTAWWLFATGFFAIYEAILERRSQMPWGWTLTWGILALATGILCLVSPPATLAAIMSVIAAFAIVSGGVLLYGAYKLSSFKSEFVAGLQTPGTR